MNRRSSQDGVLSEKDATCYINTWLIETVCVTIGNSDTVAYASASDLFDEVRMGAKGPTWAAWHFTSLEGGNIGRAEMEAAKHDLSPRDFRQEYEATFESVEGRVYHAFLRDVYERDGKFNQGNLDNSVDDPGEGLPIHVGMDFNVNPMTATLSSKVEVERPFLSDQGGKHYEMHTWREYFLHNSGTSEMMQAIRTDYPGRWLIVHPDPTGAARSTKTGNIGETDHSIIRSFGADLYIPEFRTNSDKYNCVNGLMCNTLGIRRKIINPTKCARLVNAYDGYCYKEGSNIGDKSSGLDHLTGSNQVQVCPRRKLGKFFL